MRFALLIILIIFIINWFSSTFILNGSWETVDEFTEKSDTKIYLNIQGLLQKDFRFIFSKDENIIIDSKCYMFSLPYSWAFVVKTYGYIYFTDEVPFPKKIKYCFDPQEGLLKLYSDKVYGVFKKLN